MCENRNQITIKIPGTPNIHAAMYFMRTNLHYLPCNRYTNRG